MQLAIKMTIYQTRTVMLWDSLAVDPHVQHHPLSQGVWEMSKKRDGLETTA